LEVAVLDSVLQKQILRGGKVVLITAVIFLAVRYVVPLVYPFLFGLVIAYLLNPAVNLLHRKASFPRWLASLIVILLFVGIASALIIIAFTNLIAEIGSLSDYIQQNIDDWKNRLNEFINSPFMQDVIGKWNEFYTQNPQYQETIKSNLTSTAKSLSTAVGVILGAVVSFLSALPGFLTLTLIALLAAFFITKDWFKLAARFSLRIPESTKKATRTVWSDLQRALFGYVRAQFILIFLTTLFLIIGLLVLRVDYAVTIGLLTGFCDLLPYLGPGFVLVPWIAAVFLQGNVYLGIGLSILYGIILVNRQVLEPKVLATSIGQDPLMTLIAMFVGLKLFGVLGLIIGPVTLVVIQAFQRAHVFHDIVRYVRTGSAEEDEPPVQL
jgi:sporulation integral membrane protein YtvI